MFTPDPFLLVSKSVHNGITVLTGVVKDTAEDFRLDVGGGRARLFIYPRSHKFSVREAMLTAMDAALAHALAHITGRQEVASERDVQLADQMFPPVDHYLYYDIDLKSSPNDGPICAELALGLLKHCLSDYAAHPGPALEITDTASDGASASLFVLTLQRDIDVLLSEESPKVNLVVVAPNQTRVTTSEEHEPSARISGTSEFQLGSVHRRTFAVDATDFYHVELRPPQPTAGESVMSWAERVTALPPCRMWLEWTRDGRTMRGEELTVRLTPTMELTTVETGFDPEAGKFGFHREANHSLTVVVE